MLLLITKVRIDNNFRIYAKLPLICTNTFLYKKTNLHYPNFSKYPLTNRHLENNAGKYKHPRESIQSLVLVFPKTERDNSRLLVITLKVVHISFLQKVFEKQ